MAARFPENPTTSEREAYKSFLYLFSRLYPCGEVSLPFSFCRLWLLLSVTHTCSDARIVRYRVSSLTQEISTPGESSPTSLLPLLSPDLHSHSLDRPHPVLQLPSTSVTYTTSSTYDSTNPNSIVRKISKGSMIAGAVRMRRKGLGCRGKPELMGERRRLSTEESTRTKRRKKTE